MLTAVMAAGCGSHSLDVGSSDGGGVADVARDAPPVSMLSLGPTSDASDTKQVWIGHLVKDQFPDGSNTLTMAIDFAPGGQVTGSILLGNGARLAPPTDPNVVYPPGNTGAVTLVEGFPYTILNGLLQGSHLTLQFAEAEVLTQWCALQTSYLWPCSMGPCNDAGSYGCMPPPPADVVVDGTITSQIGLDGCGYILADGGTLPYDCAKAWLCGGIGGGCECSAGGCRVEDLTGGDSLDLDLMNSEADGSLSGNFGDYPVRFTRSQ